MKKDILYIVISLFISFTANLFLNLHTAEQHDFFSGSNVLRSFIISLISVAALFILFKKAGIKKNDPR